LEWCFNHHWVFLLHIQFASKYQYRALAEESSTRTQEMIGYLRSTEKIVIPMASLFQAACFLFETPRGFTILTISIYGVEKPVEILVFFILDKNEKVSKIRTKKK